MKKIISFAVAVCFCILCFAGCETGNKKMISKEFKPENYEKYVAITYEFGTPRVEKETGEDGRFRYVSMSDVKITVTPLKDGSRFENAMISLSIKYGWDKDKLDMKLDENGNYTIDYTARDSGAWSENGKAEIIDAYKLTEDSFSVTTVEGTVKIPYSN